MHERRTLTEEHFPFITTGARRSFEVMSANSLLPLVESEDIFEKTTCVICV